MDLADLQKEAIGKYLKGYWGDSPHLTASLLHGQHGQRANKVLVDEVVGMAADDGVVLIPEYVAECAAEVLER